jgi:hypothetical protein
MSDVLGVEAWAKVEFDLGFIGVRLAGRGGGRDGQLGGVRFKGSIDARNQAAQHLARALLGAHPPIPLVFQIVRQRQGREQQRLWRHLSTGSCELAQARVDDVRQTMQIGFVRSRYDAVGLPPNTELDRTFGHARAKLAF